MGQEEAFFAYMRNELRMPISAIIEYSEILLEDARILCPEEFLRDLQKIHASSRYLLDLMSDLLDPSKIDVLKTDPDLETFGAHIRHALRTPLTHIIGYGEMLLEDARDLGQEGLIPDLQRIHTAAGRLLALIEDIVQISKIEAGQMDLDLERFGPSRAIQDVVTAIRPPTKDEPHSSEAEHGLLLIVDDNEINRDMLSRRLQRQGYTVVVAEDGRQALEKIQEQPFDLILLDLMMPEMNGYQVLEHLKADPILRHIPVIMISALDEMDSVVRCIEIGAEDYLPKPFNPVLLKARIGACLEKKRLRDREVLHLEQIEAEKKRADELLHVILPHEIVEELKATDTVRPRRYENVAVLFCDIVDFTGYCNGRHPEEVIAHLRELVESFEALALRYDLEKIKTIGDSFMAAAGLLKPVANPMLNCVKCGLEMISTAQQMSARWNVRVGIHMGPVIAGVVGHRQYLFDLWGDTVNTAARIESHGVNGSVNVSREAWQWIADQCQGQSIGPVFLKGKGEVELFRVDGLRD
ncbi:MAG: response regulator [Candidatus Tectomicrobia bacterium]|uniref:histidine kinase n=1 Tax=Tectimicrobiota bacterium TaxID=2528274 RepID=A0A932G0K3_UNCTE|nr:response regulator [Candidatus Tectomicrobia bacterium]